MSQINNNSSINIFGDFINFSKILETEELNYKKEIIQSESSFQKENSKFKSIETQTEPYGVCSKYCDCRVKLKFVKFTMGKTYRFKSSQKKYKKFFIPIENFKNYNNTSDASIQTDLTIGKLNKCGCNLNQVRNNNVVKVTNNNPGPKPKPINKIIKRCNRVKKYNCDICCKIFSKVSDYKDHMNIHYNIKNFYCYYCSKRFNQRPNCIQHLITHFKR